MLVLSYGSKYSDFKGFFLLLAKVKVQDVCRPCGAQWLVFWEHSSLQALCWCCYAIGMCLSVLLLDNLGHLMCILICAKS